MAYDRFCFNCGTEVHCQEDTGRVAGSDAVKLQLSCPSCHKLLATLYDSTLEIKPVRNAKISQG